MKKVILILMLFAGGIVLAQKGEKGGREKMKDFTPEQRASLQTKRATLALDLTEAQQIQMKAYFMEATKMRTAKMEERKAQKEGGEKKEMTSEERYEKSNARLDHQLAQKEKLSGILSDEQMAKWQKMKHRRGGKHRKGKGGKDNRPMKKE